MVNTQDTQCGRTSPGPSPRTKAKTSGASSKRSSRSSSRTPRCLRLKRHDGPTPTYTWETDGALRTELLMRNTGEFPSADVASTLSQILQAEVPEKYFLSAKACQGILRRAAERGKELPEVLQKALERQAAENHPTGGRVKIEEDGKAQTLTSRMGTGDNNVPLLLKIRSGCEGGGKGSLIQEDKSATLSCNNDQPLFEPCSWDGGRIAPTLTRHNAGGDQRMPYNGNFSCVLQAFGIGSRHSKGMMSDNPKAGYYEATSARTLDANGGNPCANQGGIAVVSPHYQVRRLTPTECARLQGFPDWWCADLSTEGPTADELSFWRGVFDTWTSLTGKKRKTDKQIIKWLKSPHSDSAEYKMWGNGVALPCVEFVLGGIARELKK